ncbi:MAG: protein kinase [Gemmatimonadota bacterium]|nr:protein kinase [Gemmatimonadota bacterium]
MPLIKRVPMDDALLEENPLAERLAQVLEGAYELEREIGRGGMGVVFAARDLALRRRVAIKVLPPELAFRQEIKIRFMREAQTAARLSHPHIVPIHAVGDEGGLVYFVMGFVDGESLGARLKRRRALPAEEVRRIMKETADALGMAHALGVVHRDIKPDNILLEGTRRRVMVTDFGIAKALSEASPGTLTGTGIAIGTPHYMSPEQAAGERDIDARSDLYALGVVAYEMATGELPFHAPTVPGILMKHISEPAPDIKRTQTDIPDDLATAIMRCLEKDPNARWPTAESLRRALENRSSGPYRPPPPRPRPSAANAGVALDRAWSRGERGVERGHERRGPDRHRPLDPAAAGRRSREPEIVRSFRAEFSRWAAVSGALMLINVGTGITEPWFLLVAGIWGFGIGTRYAKLWQAGYSWRDVLNRPPAPDAVEARMPATAAPKQLRGARDVGADEDFGPLAEQITQLRRDQAAIRQIVDKLPASERALLPDVVQTVEGLARRALDLARTLSQMEGEVDPETLARLEARIKNLRDEGGDDRRIELIERQRGVLGELVERRKSLEAQFEACVLAVQNVRFDLLRLRSAGVSAVLDDLTSATQAARVLSEDVEAAIGAASEIRRELER